MNVTVEKLKRGLDIYVFQHKKTKDYDYFVNVQ